MALRDFNRGIDMPLRHYLALVLAEHEPGVTLAGCVHDFSQAELDTVVPDVLSDLATFSLDSSWVHSKHLWSPNRVYFICDDDGRQFFASAPRDPSM